ncbi:MAG: 3-methyl-2-oxobutanoate hydroxymethyltransferase [Candidatus Margulisiibacteriota bacterium]|jgi:3-methyl-2-oxobutanoate hydroxymethyltransferase
MNLSTLKKKKLSGEIITMLTAYDHNLAVLLDQAGVDVILVGDSLGMVVRGEEDTLKVTLDDMVYHTKMVRRGCQQALLIADMPFLSYQISPEQALQNAGRLVQEGGANGVKLEGGTPFLETIKKIITAGIPVMGHLGFTPQAVNQLGGYLVQGKAQEEAIHLLEEARKLEKAGVFAIVLEMVPADVAAKVRSELAVPIIGCGAGPFCDGQVLVTNDILGLYGKKPSFAKQYINLAELIEQALKKYLNEVRTKTFPDKEHSF